MASLTAAFPTTLPIFANFRTSTEGRAWLASLPSIVLGLLDEWQLRIGRPLHGGSCSWVGEVSRPDGTPAVLKVSWPHREAREEATGLRAWDGQGAIRVYRSAPQHYALLLERCHPGTALADAELPAQDRLRVGAQLLAQLWEARVPEDSSLEHLRDVCAEWASLVRYRTDRLRPPYDRGLVDTGADLLASLPSTAARDVVVHGDLNPGNVLAAQRQPWLAIDAKPMVGDPGYDPAPLLLQVGTPFSGADPAGALRRRFGVAAEVTGEPAERLLAWAVARSVEGALWFAERGEVAAGAEEMEHAALLARIARL